MGSCLWFGGLNCDRIAIPICLDWVRVGHPQKVLVMMCSLIQVLFTLLRYNGDALELILLHRHAVNRRDGDLVVVKTDWDCISDFSQGAEQRSAISNPKNNSAMFCTKHLF
jgi:hypothetical protein